MAERRRKFWGWGYEDQGPNAEQKQRMAERMASRFGLSELTILPTPTEASLRLRAPRIEPPSALAALFTTSPWERAAHSYGRSFRDIVRAFRGEFANPFDLVAFPNDEPELIRVLE
ncbi:MAG: FAD-binding oxidoreductase, partial [Candidatus Binataceae bacterium]